MSDNDQRCFTRTKFRAPVRLIQEGVDEMTAMTGDVSDGGIFLLDDGRSLPEVGTELHVQVQGMPIEAPIVRMRVVRRVPEGIGLMFLDPPEFDDDEA